MKTSKLVFILFSVFGALFIGGSILDITPLVITSNFLLIPTLILFYRVKAKKFIYPLLIALFFFYVRDILLFLPKSYPFAIFTSFFISISILIICTITSTWKGRINAVEYVSFAIMYTFLGFLFVSMTQMIPETIPSFKYLTQAYLFALMLFLGLSFTSYLIKSHYASLWLMLAAASLLVSELSLFFKLFILEDLSVEIFFPVFHVFAYFALVRYALLRRQSNKLPYF